MAVSPAMSPMLTERSLPALRPVASATVTVTNEMTGETRTITVNEDGTFTIAALKPSKYTHQGISQ